LLLNFNGGEGWPQKQNFKVKESTMQIVMHEIRKDHMKLFRRPKPFPIYSSLNTGYLFRCVVIGMKWQK
jgi:hypothetical protein